MREERLEKEVIVFLFFVQVKENQATVQMFSIFLHSQSLICVWMPVVCASRNIFVGFKYPRTVD